jgi:protein TonB
MPEFPGGDAALLKWIADHINYPTIAQENGIQGRVSCSFTVNADGSVEDVKVARSVDPNLDKEAVRVLSMLPKFKPGEQRGKKVRVKYSVPVRFRLQQ